MDNGIMPVAVVVGGELGGLGLARALAARNVPVVILDHDLGRPTLKTRFGRKIRVPGFRGEAFIRALEGLAPELGAGPVLLPTNEDSSVSIAQFAARLTPLYRFRLPPYEINLALQRKEEFQRTAEALGCPVPRAVHIREAADLDQLRNLVFPCVLKPNLRDLAYDSRFAKAYRLDSEIEARRRCAEIIPIFPDLIVQEWIPGGNDSIYFCLQYRAGGKALASFGGRKIRSNPPMTGITASCIGAPEQAGELTALTDQYFTGMGIDGLCSMEFKLHEKTGKLVMVEPTVGRTNWQQESASLNGVEIPFIAYCDGAGLALPAMQGQACDGVVWRDTLAHWHPKWLGWQGAKPRIPAGAKVYDAHWRWNDPLPGVYTFLDWGRKNLRRLAITPAGDVRGRQA